MEKLILKLAARMLYEHGESLSNNGCNDPSSEVQEIINQFPKGALEKLVDEWNGGECEGGIGYDWIISKTIGQELQKMALEK